jgi:hypothetical protein
VASISADASVHRPRGKQHGTVWCDAGARRLLERLVLAASDAAVSSSPLQAAIIP